MKKIFIKISFSKLVVFGLILLGGVMLVGVGEVKAYSKCDFEFYVADISVGDKFLLTTSIGLDCKNNYSGTWKPGSGTVMGTCSNIKNITCVKDTNSECETSFKKTMAMLNNFTDGKEAKIVMSSINCTKGVVAKQTTPAPVGTTVDTSNIKKIPGQIGAKGTLGGVIPDCSSLPGKCRDVSIFVITLIGITRYLFSIVGALFLLMFVYGGLIWITSSGNSEKVKKGMDALMAAVIGLVIIFSAYMIVNYLSVAIGLKTTLQF